MWTCSAVSKCHERMKPPRQLNSIQCASVRLARRKRCHQSVAIDCQNSRLRGLACRPPRVGSCELESVSQVIGLFPTPVMRVEKLLSSDLIASFTAEIRTAQTSANWKSEHLSHTPVVTPQAKAMFLEIGKLADPKLAEFGEHLFGERLKWSIKEIWVNLLEPGGRQAVHTHANSFISGVLYLTRSHPSANIVFHKSLGGTDFIFSNHNKN